MLYYYVTMRGFLCRMLSMYMVVLLHVLGRGGVIEGCETFSLNYYVAWFLEVSAYCAVDVFAMISGYVMVEKKINGFKIIPLWLTVFFYSSLWTLLFYVVPLLTDFHKPTMLEIVKGFLPVTTNQYWYFSSYFAMYFFIPYLNILIDSIEQKVHKKLCVTIVAFFSLLPLINLNFVDVFCLKLGYSTLWLASLYILGAYLKKYPLALSKKKAFLLYVLSVLLIWLSKYVSHMFISIIFKRESELNVFVSYTSVFVVMSAIALISLFSRINVVGKKVIMYVSAISFSVYLIHTNRFVYVYVLKNQFISFGSESPLVLVMSVVFTSLLIFIGCLCIDSIRYALFKFMKVDRLPRLLISVFQGKH